MGNALLSCAGGEIQLPQLVLTDGEDGGHLVVNPPREVWERSELEPDELMFWSYLVAATGQAMLEVLPQLQGGCINYWEAGNWALNDLAPPVIKRGQRHLFHNSSVPCPGNTGIADSPSSRGRPRARASRRMPVILSILA